MDAATGGGERDGARGAKASPPGEPSGRPAGDVDPGAPGEADAGAGAEVHRILALSSGSLSVPRSLVSRGASGRYRLPMLWFALETGDGDVYLVDAGMRDPFAALRRWMPAAGAVLGEARPIERVLADAGIERTRVAAVLMTHLDYDHTGALPLLGHLPVTVAGRELAHARACLRGPLSNLAAPSRLLAWALRRHSAGDIGAVASWEEVEPAVIEPGGPNDPDLWPLGRATEVLPGVRMVDLPGHTPGHVGYHVRLAGGREVLLCGDAAFSAQHVVEDVEPGPFARASAYDEPWMLHTLEALRALHRRRPELPIVPSHDEATGRGPAEGAGFHLLA